MPTTVTDPIVDAQAVLDTAPAVLDPMLELVSRMQNRDDFDRARVLPARQQLAELAHFADSLGYTGARVLCEGIATGTIELGRPVPLD